MLLPQLRSPQSPGCAQARLWGEHPIARARRAPLNSRAWAAQPDAVYLLYSGKLRSLVGLSTTLLAMALCERDTDKSSR